jgi:hypothetical protein
LPAPRPLPWARRPPRPVSLRSNIKEPRFGAKFLEGFDLVIDALDNVPARRHVNRLCLAAGVPLVESGTAGYLGQARLGHALSRAPPRPNDANSH